MWVHNADCCRVDVTGTRHGNENFIGRGFTQEKVNDIARNYSEKGYQPGGLTVFIKKQANGKYDVIIVNRENKLVTAVGGNTGSLPNRKAVMKMLNNNRPLSKLPQLKIINRRNQIYS